MENNLLWFCWGKRCNLLWVSCFIALYWYIYYTVHFYIWVIWSLLRSFHVILLVLIKSAWLEFFWKALYFDFYERHIQKGHIQEIEIVSEAIYKKGKVLYAHTITERKKAVKKLYIFYSHLLSSWTFYKSELYSKCFNWKKFLFTFPEKFQSKKWKCLNYFVKREIHVTFITSYVESY